MATSSNTIKTRIQLKSDTEANWNKAGPKEGSSGFIPLLGELIVYTEDDTHPFSRLKIGDGSSDVVSLPFINAGIVRTFTNTSLFPSPGEENVIYIDLQYNILYCYKYSSGYHQLSNFDYTIETAAVSHIERWLNGSMTSLQCRQG